MTHAAAVLVTVRGVKLRDANAEAFG